MKKIYKCKFCDKIFEDFVKGNKHGCICGQTFKIIKEDKMMDFWIPKYRWQLVEWFKKNRPDWQVSKWSKNRLLAVYMQERRKLLQYKDLQHLTIIG